MSAIESPLGSPSVSTARLSGASDTEADLRGEFGFISVLARFGSAARGDPLYEVGVAIGRLLRTVFLADYFVNCVFRREPLRVLNRGGATNALKRLIYTGRVAGYQAKSEDEMQAVADAVTARTPSKIQASAH